MQMIVENGAGLFGARHKAYFGGFAEKSASFFRLFKVSSLILWMVHRWVFDIPLLLETAVPQTMVFFLPTRTSPRWSLCYG